MRKRYRHKFELNRTAAEAFPLFTPRGEEDWVPGWQPEYLAPTSGATSEGMLFTTGKADDRTYWTCLEWQPEKHHVRYLRLTPNSRSAYVDVNCHPLFERMTEVTVRYDIISLGPEGEAYIQNMTDIAFAEMIGEWPLLIARAPP